MKNLLNLLIALLLPAFTLNLGLGSEVDRLAELEKRLRKSYMAALAETDQEITPSLLQKIRSASNIVEFERVIWDTANAATEPEDKVSLMNLLTYHWKRSPKTFFLLLQSYIDDGSQSKEIKESLKYLLAGHFTSSHPDKIESFYNPLRAVFGEAMAYGQQETSLAVLEILNASTSNSLLVQRFLDDHSFLIQNTASLGRPEFQFGVLKLLLHYIARYQDNRGINYESKEPSYREIVLFQLMNEEFAYRNAIVQLIGQYAYDHPRFREKFRQVIIDLYRQGSTPSSDPIWKQAIFQLRGGFKRIPKGTPRFAIHTPWSRNPVKQISTNLYASSMSVIDDQIRRCQKWLGP